MIAAIPALGATSVHGSGQVRISSTGPGAPRGDFASVLADAVSHVRASSLPTELVRPTAPASPASPVPAAVPEAAVAKAMAAEQPLLWLAAPLVSRAIEAYRELMNTSV